jgi:hypothetical protein
MNIATLASRTRRELAQRVNGGLEITLYWHPHDNSTSVEIHEATTDETISFPVPADRALEAFNHPFAHLGDRIEQERQLVAIDLPSRN